MMIGCLYVDSLSMRKIKIVSIIGLYIAIARQMTQRMWRRYRWAGVCM